MTDAEYHARFREAILCALVDNPTGAGIIRGISEYAKRGATEKEVAARVLQDIYCCDGSQWDAHDAGHWFDADMNCMPHEDIRWILK